jgi:putative transposase
VLGLVEGATENATVVTGLLEDLVARGIGPGRRRLFVIDGSKALRAAIDRVYGADNPVQRCRNHKVRNVTEHVPELLKDQMKGVMRAAFRLPYDSQTSRRAQEGMQRSCLPAGRSKALSRECG